MSIKRNNITIGVSAEQLNAVKEQLINEFQDKRITWQGTSDVLVTTVLQRLWEYASGKVQIVLADTMPENTEANTQYWVKTYDDSTLEDGRYIIMTDHLNNATFIGTSSVDLSEYIKEEQIVSNLANDYYYCFMRGSDNFYTKSLYGTNIDVYTITIGTGGNVTAIAKQENKGSIINGSLSYNGRNYLHNSDYDGFYIIDSVKKIISVSSLRQILHETIKIKDVILGDKTTVVDNTAIIKTIDDLESNFYYAFKNDSNYYYTKSKAEGSTAYYQLTYTDNKLTKIENKGNVTVTLNTNRIPQITVNGAVYTLDETKNDYYIIDAEHVVPTAKAVTQDLTNNDLNRIFEDFYMTPPNPTWKYVGILSASNGSVLNVQDDWTELLLVMRVSEGSSYFNLTNVLPKYGFTYGSPNGNNTFAGFYWNESYNCKLRVGLEGTGTNRNLKQNYLNQVGWALNGIYVFKR